MPPTARRQFLRNATLGLLLWPNKTGACGGEVAVPAANVPPVNAPPFRSTAGHFYLAHNPDGLLAM